ncbi:hypothetical protein [Stackebrandtia nassauensis]|uniref:Uncharacterized protein n=1 Tax=Stackebrandtia nassauensis (strain DSM 44728 / CIP 108903 / NRRL B-16338 / NBRC 102104 / LLR-40K-21) TaxID=446470 RepID=D3PTX5_STANL|nr:hypothetical protein [Stackebrandtia nassauensis]ADD39733.1 hypothetical protein Snas_0010 [Stackebrandtia nassauensis DSM 44728]
MNARTKYRAMLRAGLVGDFDAAEQLGTELGEVAWNDSGLLVNALFVLAVQRKFDDDTDRDVIREFVRETLDDYKSADPPFKPLMTEGLIRSVLGEEELYPEIPKNEAIPVQTAIINKIVADARTSPDKVDELLDKAEKLADRWIQQSK